MDHPCGDIVLPVLDQVELSQQLGRYNREDRAIENTFVMQFTRLSTSFFWQLMLPPVSAEQEGSVQILELTPGSVWPAGCTELLSAVLTLAAHSP